MSNITTSVCYLQSVYNYMGVYRDTDSYWVEISLEEAKEIRERHFDLDPFDQQIMFFLACLARERTWIKS